MTSNDSSADQKTRFASVSEANLLQIMTDKDSKKTKKANDCAINAFKAYLREKGRDYDILSYSPPELDSVLCKFYAEARTMTGELYKKSSLVAIRHGLNRVLDSDIVSGEEFANSRKMFSAVVVDLKRQGKGGGRPPPTT